MFSSGYDSVSPLVTVDLNTMGYVRLLFRLRVTVRSCVQESVLVDYRHLRRSAQRDSWSRSLDLRRSGQRCGTFVRIVLDACALVYRARHHACSGEQSVVNRVGRDICITVAEVNINDDQVVDMVQMISDLICCDLACNPSHNKIPCRSIGDLVGDV
jgi:hypothetical protein